MLENSFRSSSANRSACTGSHSPGEHCTLYSIHSNDQQALVEESAFLEFTSVFSVITSISYLWVFTNLVAVPHGVFSDKLQENWQLVL